MTTDSAPRIKITYATLSADNEELHAGFEAAVAEAKTKLGWHYKNYIDGEWRDGAETFEARSPIDRDLLRRDVRDRHRPPTSTPRSPRRAPPSRPGPRSRGASASRSSAGRPSTSATT